MNSSNFFLKNTSYLLIFFCAKKKSYICAMNFLKLLLTIYFMVLTLVPCNDVNNHPQNNVNQSYSALLNSEDSHSKNQGDICSPLCSCSCCHITVGSFKLNPSLLLPKKTTGYHSKKILFEKNDYVSLVHNKIWLPPKV